MAPDHALMRQLVISPYPPTRDGIGSYALQEVRALRAQGHVVDVLSPEPSAAHHHLDFRDPRAPFALARRLRRYDRVVAQYHPQLFYVSSNPDLRAALNLGLIAAFAWGGNLELRVHEWDGEPVRRGRWRDELTRAMFLSAQRITVHSTHDRDRFSEHFAIDPARVDVVDHGAAFSRLTSIDRSTARRELGLPQDEHIFLCIGFIQRHKGFDRAVRAFTGLAERGCRLDIVGSVRVEDPIVLEFAAELRRLAERTDGVHLHEAYVSDEVFDLWIVAADTIVLPYREIFTSSVLERASMYERNVVVTRTGGLVDQAPPDARFVDDDAALAEALRELAGDPRTKPSEPWDAETLGDVDRVMSEIRRRAAAQRGRAMPHEDTGDATAPLRRISPLALPRPTSARPIAALAKWIVRRVTAWEVDPIIGQVNELRRGTIEAFEHERTTAESA